MNISDFQNLIWDFYKHNRRDFVWRNSTDPYHIFVSEVMLQQTQTYRVEPKFLTFIEQLPTFKALAQAPGVTVLSLWQGLGYNRRALFLQKAAHVIHCQYDGILPDDPTLLIELPGIGKATAASITAFAFNKPTIFIETNIRTVYLHTFFPGKVEVTDQELLPFITATVDKKNPREWYYALMDYGVMLKAHTKNPSRNSAHYTKQSPFKGSDRQVRGFIIKTLTEKQSIERLALLKLIQEKFAHIDYEKAEKIICKLLDENFFQNKHDIFYI